MLWTVPEVLDLVEVIDGEFERGRHLVIKVAEVVELVGVNRGERRRALAGLDPEIAVEFLNVEAGGAGVHPRRAGAFAFAASIESPAVVFALEPVADDFAIAELEPPMRANVINGGGLAVRGAEEADEPVGERDPYRLPAELAAGQDRMPMVEHGHRWRPPNSPHSIPRQAA